MKRYIVLSNLLLTLFCNQAKEVSLDASKSLTGLSLDLIGSNYASQNDDTPGPEFLAVGVGCTVWTSNDGENWSARGGSGVFPGCSGGSLYSVAYGNGTWVAVGTLIYSYVTRDNNSGIWYSKDGETWTQVTAPVDSGYATLSPTLPLRSVSYGKVGGVNKFIAAGTKLGQYSGAVDRLYIIQSTDGVNWTTFENLPTFGYGSFYGSCYVAFYNDKFYCPSEYGEYEMALEYDPANPPAAGSPMTSFPNGTGHSLESLSYAPPPAGVYDLYGFHLYPARSGAFYVFGNLLSNGDAIVSKLGSNGKWPASTSIGLGVNNYPHGFVDFGDHVYAFGNNCRWSYSNDQGASWSMVSTLDLCGGSAGYNDWIDATYSSKLNRMVVVGDGGSIGTTNIAPSSSSDWKYVKAAGVSLEITSVVSKHK
ncbi:hypothetical protein EHQ27_16990 [Leptospira wolffii]|uniref:Exo-alpha-sialidase n=1 Tax=Leptospira wolffii TaxID=409998 RepID=A0A2M9Z7A5_9LEPT|nr:hypothetical protein [Leptospira wolffii]PJZ64313.1 hypothetical protein CH371_17985 [Leptospira wolffii]TGK58276.1 hypothetical protein EHQ32_13395 [Leptospira wolffii]TGK66347.1 hypothetical protein EHQ27_16990 [Leptospira wolffii]TGK68954.1 hypothetical protein EHQ35_19265 [Leptospira wolffii]TGL27306.1 hypothetical protein EHQ57_17245 [Leptospira wolffii]